MKPRLPYAMALLSILILAVALRFAHLGGGLRHVPHADEQVFVENSALLATHRTLDHRYYEYPGLIFYLSAIALLVKGTSVPAGPEDYLLVRGLLAGSGVLSVLLVALLGRRLLGPAGGLAAALLLAVRGCSSSPRTS